MSGTGAGHQHRLGVGTTTIGRTKGTLVLGDDVFISAHHATLSVKDSTLTIRDESSDSGTYVSITGQEPIAMKAFFAVGRRLFRFVGPVERMIAPLAAVAVYGAPVPKGQVIFRVEEVLVGNRGGRAVVSGGPLLTIGQRNCDLSYPDDEGLASRHCEITPTPHGAMLRDLSGGLGTFVRLRPATERPLKPGDQVRLGQTVLRVEVTR